ncbi:MAG: DNA mismatch repair protein MutS [Deltaproteobacteria bacterium]|nr:MAG: DNA mismatch repair protein MutS [Deltaproteobacteria bacterium]
MTADKKATKLTPMLEQYMEIKKQHTDAILFYRMGDFYEMFFDDAIEAARILNIALTSRNKKTDPVQVPMCGIPYHAVQGYLPKLIRAGKRVAICEQVENPAEAKGIVKRGVIRIVSPGIITDDNLLDEKSNNYICAITHGKDLAGVSFLDVSTGEFLLAEYTIDQQESTSELFDQLSRFAPTEILLEESEKQQRLEQRLENFLPEVCISHCRAEYFHLEDGREALLRHFKVLNLDGFGCGGMSQGLAAAGALLQYAEQTQKASIAHIEKLTPIETETILHLDESSRRNLELVQTIVGGSRQGSLLATLDQTVTPMGARLLRQQLLFPLRDTARIKNRLDALTWFFHNSVARQRFRELLNEVYDLERLNSRMILGTGNARDMLAIGKSLAALPELLKALAPCDTEKLAKIREQFDPLPDLYELLERAIDPEAPVTLRDGNLIRKGYDASLDQLKSLLRDGKKNILEIENRERQATGISKLKVGFNKVFGYFIEVSKLHASAVPAHYIRKQTLVNAERFITEELKEFETRVLGAQERSVELEYELFIEVRRILAANSSRILHTAGLLAQLDVLLCHAETAHRYDYRRPVIDQEQEIKINEGRHPVIERMMPAGKFVPNDIFLDQKKDEMQIITGPNMAGKSTILRQTALIVLMAQMGCYVPAKQAKIGIVDRIFTRVGAMDNLRQGQSTFMVEMSETANILNNATAKSLVILDEIGRGTSTYDGLSIAWAVAEELVNKNGIGVKTLFATHYHELTDLARSHQRVRNYSIGVREWKGEIIFLHKLMKGGTSRSYGIEVAALAGVPAPVVKRAGEILKSIENGKFSAVSKLLRQSERQKEHIPPAQLPLFSPPPHPVLERLKAVNPDNCTPIEALQLLYQLKKEESGQ